MQIASLLRYSRVGGNPEIAKHPALLMRRDGMRRKALPGLTLSGHRPLDSRLRGNDEQLVSMRSAFMRLPGDNLMFTLLIVILARSTSP
jgi:hypothetical protein